MLVKKKTSIYFAIALEALVNEDILLPTHANVSLFARACNICCGHKFCVRDTRNISEFVQKHIVVTTNVSQFAQPKKHHAQQCVRNNVSSFTRAFSLREISFVLYVHALICAVGCAMQY